MKYDIVIAGIGGQGVTTAARILAEGARRAGLRALRSKPQHPAGRGGAVMVHVRIGTAEPEGDVIPDGQADLILALEPLESMRHLHLLSPAGAVVSATEPVQNIPRYPDSDELLLGILKMPAGFVIDATAIAGRSGGVRAANVALLGAAAGFVPMDPSDLREAIAEVLVGKTPQVVELNLAAFEAGRAALRHREVVDEFDTFAIVCH